MIILLIILNTFIPISDSVTQLDYGSAPSQEDYASGIPVITYHQISTHQSTYSASPSRLRSDLQKLYNAGFFLIQPADLEDGLTRVPFNRIPIMITFDDGWENNFRYIEQINGEHIIDPDCAVAIVNTFLEEHPDFGQGVVFFISWDKVPFGNNTEEKFNSLLDMGHVIGNHSADHLSFTKIAPSHYYEQILPAFNNFQNKLGLRTNSIIAFAYPGGQIPRGISAEETLSSIEFQNRQAVAQGYLVDGAVGNFNKFYNSDGIGRYRISRIDMAIYSVHQLLNWSNIMVSNENRTSIHDDLPWRP